MAYFDTNEVRDFLVAYRKLGATEATYFQTYIERMVAAYPPTGYDGTLGTGRNSSLVAVLETAIRPIMQIASAVYGLGLSAANIKAYIRQYFSSYALAADTYGDVIYTDLGNLVGTPDPADNLTAKEEYLARASNVLTKAAKYMRHFAGIDMADSVGNIGEQYVAM